MDINATLLLDAMGEYVQEDDIKDFLEKIEFDFDDLDDDSINYILTTDNSTNDKIFELILKDTNCNILDDFILNDHVDVNDISSSIIEILEEKYISNLDNNDIDIIEKILRSDLVNFEYPNSIDNGIMDFETSDPCKNSKLSTNTIRKLFNIYAEENHWYMNINICTYFSNVNACIEEYNGYYPSEKHSSILSYGKLDINETKDLLDRLGYDVSNLNESTTFSDLGVSWKDYCYYVFYACFERL